VLGVVNYTFSHLNHSP